LLWAELVQNTHKAFTCTACARIFVDGARLDVYAIRRAANRLLKVEPGLEYCRKCMQAVLPVVCLPGVLSSRQRAHIQNVTAILAHEERQEQEPVGLELRLPPA
jgi:hypothetical protein